MNQLQRLTDGTVVLCCGGKGCPKLNVDDNLITNDGFINLSDAKVAAISGCDGYSFPKKFLTKLITNISYEPKKVIKKILDKVP